MADAPSAWGIDIGQSALKAIRLRYASQAGQALAVAFDYIPHPKILSQPDANANELIRQALKTFLERNDVRGDKVVISVPGATSLARFIQLPPVEAGKVKDIVKFEARQQIPFALEEVIWDFQTLGATMEEGGFLLNAEVGLFAMKKTQVAEHLAPFLEEKVEVDVIQTAPLSLFNFVGYDRMGIRVDDETGEGFDEHTIILDMGADMTTLLVTNGSKIWIRNVPIGGNHFTRALSKDQKLTFPKAEHLKCNATRSPDPRAVFGALRPVFNDYVSEIQRSIGFFSSVNREAKIGKILGVGNGFKLAGLQRFLQQNLQYEVERVESFDALVGDAVLNAPQFAENIMSFVVPYGLAIQGLGQTSIHTNLLPPEIRTERIIRAKKPWAAAAAASLLASLALSAGGYAAVYETVSPDRFGAQEQKAKAVQTEASGYKSAYDAEVGVIEELRTQADTMTKPLSAPNEWLELYKAINACLPEEPNAAVAKANENDPRKWNRVKVKSVTTKYYEDLSEWYSSLAKSKQAALQYLAPDDKTPPVGGGYVVTLETEHYHEDKSDPVAGSLVPYLAKNFLEPLQQWKVEDPPGTGKMVPVEQIGISHATIVRSEIDSFEYAPDAPPSVRRMLQAGRGPGVMAGGAGRGFGRGPMGPMGPGGRPFNPQLPVGPDGQFDPSANPDDQQYETIEVPRTSATIQFIYQPIKPENRTDERPSEGGEEGTDPGAPAV